MELLLNLPVSPALRETLLDESSLSDSPQHPLPPQSPYCVVFPGFLSPTACAALIGWSEAAGFTAASSDYPPSYRDNDRLVRDEAALATLLTTRLRPLAPRQLPGEAVGEAWAFQAINERLRLCRYRAGQSFQLHQDGVHHRSAEVRSRLTFMIYLTDGADFRGGDTLFYSAGPGGDAGGQPARLISRVRPRAGTLILFDHALWHAGDQVTRGVKHILRSDVLYRRHGVATGATDGIASPAPYSGHAGYVWSLQRLATGRLASGGRDAIIRLWDEKGACVGSLRGHEQSVLGLAELPDGRLASVSRDRSLRLWDLASGSHRSVRAHETAVLTVAALPNSQLATGAADGSIRLWSAADLAALGTLSGHLGWVWQVAPLGEDRLVSASEDGSVRIWELREGGECSHVLPGRTPLRALAVLGAGVAIVTGDVAGEIVVWRPSGGTWSIAQSWQAHAAAVRALRVIRPGLLASAGEDHLARLWHWDDDGLRPQSAPPARHANFVTDLATAPGGYVSCSYDGRITLQALA